MMVILEISQRLSVLCLRVGQPHVHQQIDIAVILCRPAGQPHAHRGIGVTVAGLDMSRRLFVLFLGIVQPHVHRRIDITVVGLDMSQQLSALCRLAPGPRGKQSGRVFWTEVVLIRWNPSGL